MIALAKQNGGSIDIYDENGNKTAYMSSSTSTMQLVGYTATTVTAKRGHVIEIYDERGYKINEINA